MPALSVQPADLTVHDPALTTARAETLIEAALGQIRFYAPAVFHPGFAHDDYARGLVVRALVAGAARGDVTTTTTGPATIRRDTRPRQERPEDEILPRRVIAELQRLTGAPGGGPRPRGSFPPAPRDLFGRL